VSEGTSRGKCIKIAILGAGSVGTGLGKRLAAAGHEIVVSFARTPVKLAGAAQAIGHSARAGTPESAVRDREVILLATPWAATLDLVRSLQPLLVGKILWDTTNAFAPDMSELLDRDHDIGWRGDCAGCGRGSRRQGHCAVCRTPAFAVAVARRSPAGCLRVRRRSRGPRGHCIAARGYRD
jgi:6-phosphogluconate dehydrogenase (decarboxylating)